MAESAGTTRVGVIGLGQAGRPIARSLLHARLPVTVYDVRSEAVQDVSTMGATAATGPGTLAERCDVVITSLPHPSVSEEVILGPGGVVERARPGTVLMETSTVLPSLIQRIEKAASARGVLVMDAGISGIRFADTTEGAFLTMMLGASSEAMDRARPALDALAAKLFHVGPPGMGMTAKLVNNAMALTHVATYCEAISLGVKAGADPATLFSVISMSGGSSRQFVDNFPRRVLKGNFEGGFAIDLSAKDLALVLEWAREMKMPLHVIGAAYSVHEWARARGLGDKDMSVLMTLWEELAGVKVSG